MKTNLDEIKLTAYALNELDETSRAAVEKMLAIDPVARRWVEEVRRTAAVLEQELQAEECPALTTEQTREIQQQIHAEKPSIWTRRWFPSLRLVEALAVIAIIAVLTALLLPALSKTKNKARNVAMLEQQNPVNLESPVQKNSQPVTPQQTLTTEPPVADANILTTPAVVPPANLPVDTIAPAPVVTSPAPASAMARPTPAMTVNQSVALNLSDSSTRIPQGVSGPSLAPGSPVAGNAPRDADLPPVVTLFANQEGNPSSAGRPTQTRASAAVSDVNGINFQQGTSASTGDGNNQNNGAVVGYINTFSGAGGFRDRRDLDRLHRNRWAAPTAQPNTESYATINDNQFLSALDNPLSTFSIDVDTAAYANVRRFLTENQLPPPDAVRIEEMINYFSYNYPQPRSNVPFSVNVEIAGCPWNEGHRLVRVGLKGREIARDKRPASNLVFLIDVSGSMDEPNKLPLLKESLKLLTRQLNENDHVSIVVYAGAAGMVLPETSGSDKATILRALDRLSAGGSTHGSAGIRLAYETASENFIQGGVNRVILCTDGDFNVGVTSPGDLTRLITDKAKSGVFLSVLGFGMGNYKDSTMEALADKGNGNYAYIDSLNEGRKVLVEQMSGTLVTIAKDVKIQIEFNPAQVNSYRLIGYENRLLAKEDFNNDKKDAGEIGAGHTVTALYEIVPAGMTPDETPGVDPLKYQKPARPAKISGSDEMLTLKLRYKQPDGDTSRLVSTPVKDSGRSYRRASADFKFAAAVAEFGMLLRHSPYAGDATFRDVWENAKAGLSNDPEGYRAEFLTLVETAQRLAGK